MAFQSFEELEVWQRGCRLAVDVFKIFATCRNFTMQDQIQRSALSVPSNVAEGYERDSNRDLGPDVLERVEHVTRAEMDE